VWDALESLQGNWASIHTEGGISRSFSSCGRKLWVPSSCDGDLRELLMVPMGSQVSFHVVRGLLGFLWGQCNGRGPHLQLRWEPQDSSPFLTWILGCVCSFKQGVRSRLRLRHGTLLSSPQKSSQASSRVDLGTWGFSRIWKWGISPPFGL